MAYIKNEYRATEKTERFPYIPQPEDYGALSFFTSSGHEFLKKSYYMARKDFDFYMINYVVNGTGALKYGNKTHLLKKGDLSFIYLGDENVFYPTSDELEIYFFHVSGTPAKAFYKAATEKGKNVFENFPESVVIKTFERIKEQLNGERSYFELSKISNSLLTDILDFSLKKPAESYPPFIMNVIYVIRDGVYTSVKDVAKAVGFDPIYLERVYKKHTGKSIKQTLSERDINRTQNLLLTTDMSVAKIAELIGYSDPNGLIRLFKRHVGVTPLSYRKQNKR